MQTRFRPVLIALGALLFVRPSLAQKAPAADKPAASDTTPRTSADEAGEGGAKATPDQPDTNPSDTTGTPARSDSDTKATPPAASAPTPAGVPETQPTRVNPLPLLPEPGADTAALQRMGKDRPQTLTQKDETEVVAEDWWSHVRPILELHGYFRVRAELFYRFSLGRIDDPLTTPIWPRPPDSPYRSLTSADYGQQLCSPSEAGTGASSSLNSPVGCKNNTQAGANLRFRLNPELHISDNLRVMTQIDLLDNVVLGSTSSGYYVTPSGSGYNVGARNGYEPVGFADQTTNPPVAGVNGLRNSINVKRVWAEYTTPVGELRFGRMPNHWGLGIVNNAGDGYDDDYQSTIDRVQFVAAIKPLELYLSGAWDFPNSGPTSDTISAPAAQPYDLSQLDNVNQYVFSVVRKKSPELTRLALTRGELVINGGLQFTYRQQLLDPINDPTSSTNSCSGAGANGAASLGCAPGTLTYVRRDAHYVLPDLWLQLLYKQFRFELEAATIQGSIGNPKNTTTASDASTNRYTMASWGLATELEQRLVENRLRLGFNFGWAEGDQDVDGLAPLSQQAAAKSATTNPSLQAFGQNGNDRTISTFRFNPAYRIDLILYRNILTRVQGTYYFRPSLTYDFVRDSTGQRIGGSVAGIWSRASQFIQAPGHARDLGIELNGALYYQSKDGALNDDPSKMGGFYARLEYGILFPLAGLGYPPQQASNINALFNSSTAADVSTAQIVRLYLGVLF